MVRGKVKLTVAHEKKSLFSFILHDQVGLAGPLLGRNREGGKLGTGFYTFSLEEVPSSSPHGRSRVPLH